LDAIAPVLRMRLSFARAPAIDHGRIYLIEGDIGPGHLRQIKQGELSKALSKRLQPALVWADETAHDGVFVAPTVPLERGAEYTLAGGDPLFSFPLRVLEEDAVPWMARIWPPADSGATVSLGIWCGDVPQRPLTAEATLEPHGPRGMIYPGAVDGAGMRCARFEASSPADSVTGDAFVGPPTVALAQGSARLDPRPFILNLEDVELVPVLACEADEIPFGPGCAQILDDRLIGRAPEEPLLWVVAAAPLGIDEVFATASGDPFVVAPLPPLTDVSLDVSVINLRGEVARSPISATTLAPMPHVILNEVLANPLGAEPVQEWVEIVNDGAVAADLNGYVLVDIGGETVLPGVELLPGEFAIIANETYNEADDELDPSPPEGTLIVRVPKLGKDGLGNSGEPLKLLDPEGRVVSRTPGAPKPKAGWSVARLRPSAPDGISGSFGLSAPTPGKENSP
jgi:hypothetical protein